MLTAVDWRRDVEAAVVGYASDVADEVLDSVAFVEALDGTLELDGEDLVLAVAEAVDGWLEAAGRGEAVQTQEADGKEHVFEDGMCRSCGY